MTLSSDVIKFFRVMYNSSIYPKIGSDNVIINSFKCWPKTLSLYSNVVIDLMVNIRGLSDKIDAEGMERTISCLEFVTKIAETGGKILRNNKEQIKLLILRLDRINGSPLSKGGIYDKRYKKIEEYKFDKNINENPFKHENLMPSDIHSIFKNNEARILFYNYLTCFLIEYFEDNIWGDQKVIIDGGIRSLSDWNRDDYPFLLERNNELNGNVEIKKVSYPNPYLKQGEADLGCPFWANKIPGRTIIQCEDGDMILICLLQRSKYKMIHKINNQSIIINMFIYTINIIN